MKLFETPHKLLIQFSLNLLNLGPHPVRVLSVDYIKFSIAHVIGTNYIVMEC